MRRVEGAARPAVARGHQRFEYAAEHLGIDRRFAPPIALFASGEAILHEQLAEHRTNCIIAEYDAAAATLERRSREQPAVQKGNAPELPSTGRAPRWTCVQGPEEQRQQNAAVVLAASQHAVGERALEKTRVAVQPTLRLEKGQEEQPGDAQHRQLRAHFVACATGGGHHVGHHALERAVEAAGERFAPERIDPAGVREHVQGRSGRGERRHRVHIAGHDLARVDDECGQLRTSAACAPRGEHHLRTPPASEHQHPEEMRCGPCDTCRHGRGTLARAAAAVRLYDQRAKRSGPGSEERLPSQLTNAEGCCKVVVNGERVSETEGACKVVQSRARPRTREQRGQILRVPHARTLRGGGREPASSLRGARPLYARAIDERAPMAPPPRQSRRVGPGNSRRPFERR